MAVLFLTCLRAPPPQCFCWLSCYFFIFQWDGKKKDQENIFWSSFWFGLCTRRLIVVAVPGFPCAIYPAVPKTTRAISYVPFFCCCLLFLRQVSSLVFVYTLFSTSSPSRWLAAANASPTRRSAWLNGSGSTHRSRSPASTGFAGRLTRYDDEKMGKCIIMVYI